AKLRLFAGDDAAVEPADLRERAHAHHRIAAARAGLADWGVPLDVAEFVVTRRLGMSLAPPAADHAELFIPGQILRCALDPPGDDFAIAIDELHELTLRINCQEF